MMEKEQHEPSFLKQIFLSLFADGKVKSQSDFAKKIGDYDRGYMSNLLKSTDDLPPKIQKGLNKAFGINMLYLSTNGKEGSMFGEPEPEKTKRRIPMMGEGVAGTDMELNVTEDNGYVGEYIDIGDLLKDSEAAFTVYGNSMTPAYPPGCVVGVKLNYDKFIQPGETYLVLTKSNRVFKRLYNTDDGEGYICFSDNTMKHEGGPLEGKYHYPTFVIPKADIISIFDVTGMIKRNRNSGIIQRQK